MCGIAGYLHRHDAARRDVVERQLRTVEHRGPDATGIFATGRGAVGQNRLSVIDLATGDPPITNEDGTIGVAFNGEIYNFRELRRDLASRHLLTTSGDTEVLAHLAEDCPPVEIARRITGMAAFAIWDGRSEQLVLGRDRLGKKPLYYWVGRDTFVFGSEIKAVLAHASVTADVDTSVVPDYLTFGYVPTPDTFFRGVRSLPPAHVLVVGPDLEPALERYWRAPLVGVRGERADLTFPEAARETRRALSAAVRQRLVADVPLGAFLSGGIDSSTVVGLMAEHASTVKTFTIGFEESAFDERAVARLVADRFGTDHTEFVVRPDAVDLVERLVFHHDQPFGDSSAIPTFLLAELTRPHVTVALAGDGGDECFAGYERFAAGTLAARLEALPGSSGVLGLAASAAGIVPGGLAAKFSRFARSAGLGLPRSFRSWVEYVPAPAREALGGAEGDGVRAYRALWDETAGAQPLDRLLALNLETYLLDDLLPKVDRMAMAHSLEVRSPFLDHDVVELAFRLPPAFKARGVSLKRVLKAAVADLLPREVTHGRKRGFGVPLDGWFRTSLAGYVDSMLGSESAAVRHVLRGDGVDALLHEHRTGAANHGHALWTLLTLEVFLRAHG